MVLARRTVGTSPTTDWEFSMFSNDKKYHFVDLYLRLSDKEESYYHHVCKVSENGDVDIEPMDEVGPREGVTAGVDFVMESGEIVTICGNEWRAIENNGYEDCVIRELARGEVETALRYIDYARLLDILFVIHSKQEASKIGEISARLQEKPDWRIGWGSGAAYLRHIVYPDNQEYWSISVRQDGKYVGGSLYHASDRNSGHRLLKKLDDIGEAIGASIVYLMDEFSSPSVQSAINESLSDRTILTNERLDAVLAGAKEVNAKSSAIAMIEMSAIRRYEAARQIKDRKDSDGLSL